MELQVDMWLAWKGFDHDSGAVNPIWQPLGDKHRRGRKASVFLDVNVVVPGARCASMAVPLEFGYTGRLLSVCG